MSQPSSDSALATRLVSSYAMVPGLARAEPKIVTRKRSWRVGRSRVRLLTTLHNPMTESMSTCFTPSSSAKLMTVGSASFALIKFPFLSSCGEAVLHKNSEDVSRFLPLIQGSQFNDFHSMAFFP